MTLFQRTLIETKLRGFEAGRFQEFVLRFLPLFDENHNGMIRQAQHQATWFSKTGSAYQERQDPICNRHRAESSQQISSRLLRVGSAM